MYLCTVRRHRMDDHVNGSCATHDSRSWVGVSKQPRLPNKPDLANVWISFFYSGLARRKSALSLLWLSIMATAVVSFQWFFWGYSLAFSHNAGPFIGTLDNFGFKGVLARPSVGGPRIPDLLFAIYQGMFACIT